MSEFLELMKKRRSVYGIDSGISIGDDELKSLLGELLNNTPSAFNMQSQRMVLLLGENHKKLWNIVLETLRALKGDEGFERTEEKMAGFAAGHGTVLFFDDTAVTDRYAVENQSYSSNFPIWAQQQNGMLQHAVWVALAEKDIGASLQHYNPLIDDKVRQEWDLPGTWKLIAQMPFGNITAHPDKKIIQPLEERFFIF